MWERSHVLLPLIKIGLRLFLHALTTPFSILPDSWISSPYIARYLYQCQFRELRYPYVGRKRMEFREPYCCECLRLLPIRHRNPPNRFPRWLELYWPRIRRYRLFPYIYFGSKMSFHDLVLPLHHELLFFRRSVHYFLRCRKEEWLRYVLWEQAGLR